MINVADFHISELSYTFHLVCVFFLLIDVL